MTDLERAAKAAYWAIQAGSRASGETKTDWCNQSDAVKRDWIEAAAAALKAVRTPSYTTTKEVLIVLGNLIDRGKGFSVFTKTIDVIASRVYASISPYEDEDAHERAEFVRLTAKFSRIDGQEKT